MSKGVLLFAFDNEHFDYVAMAAWTAKNIKRHLDLSVTVVTDSDRTKDLSIFDHVVSAVPQGTGKRYFDDLKNTVVWNNANRVDAFNLSPYDQTLVLDVDYVVASNQLRSLFNTQQSFLCHRWAFDVTGLSSFDDLNYFGNHQMPMSWATVMYFDKSAIAADIFEMMTMIRQHWNHYLNLYGIGQPNYRNDHSLSIALNTIYGHQGHHPEIPWRLASVVPEHKLSQIDTDQYRIDFTNSDKKDKYIFVNNMDFHAMGKKHLGDIVANSS
jgi:hypothetical protein